MTSSNFINFGLSILKRFNGPEKLNMSRRWINRLGRMVYEGLGSTVHSEKIVISKINCSVITPKDLTSSAIILYLHGGGYCTGGLDYAKGFGGVLSQKCGLKVICPEYRLAPEYPFPYALEDVLDVYGYLLSSGYDSSQIILFGESAGGGLCYSLCHRLKEKNWPLPSCIITNSPWVDLRCDSQSYLLNKSKDPFLTEENLKFYASSFVGKDKVDNPYISPILGKMDDLPPSLIFVGENEILLDDSKKLYEKIANSNSYGELIVKPDKWHAYLLFGIKENEADFKLIRKFIRQNATGKKKLKWMSLDNAAKIFPAARKRNWSNVFRLSATFNEAVDREIMQSALDVTVRRFPSIAVRVKTGFFWYYLEEIKAAPEIIDEKPYPLSKMPFDDIRKCAFRVIIFNNRIAVEFFHAVTDGNGGLVFLKTLIAEYLYQKYGVKLPTENGILNRLEEPDPLELEDSFQKYAGDHKASRKDTNSFRILDNREVDGFKTNTTFIMDADTIVKSAKEIGVSVTAYISAALLLAASRVQEKTVRKQSRFKPVKVTIPVNLRNIFPSVTLRNFALYANMGFDPKYGQYDFIEICKILSHEMKLKITDKKMAALIAVNVGSEKPLLLRMAPLFLKNIVMKTIFNSVGEKKGCFSFSNLGVVNVPEDFKKYVNRMDFVLGVQADAPYNTSGITYDGKFYLNIIRNISTPILEKELCDVFKEIGLDFCVESNSRN